LLAWLSCCAWAQAPDPAQRIRHLLIDWAGLTRYGSEDAEVRPPKPGENRVVFLGDEITENWGKGEAKFFPGKPYLNRGIQHQTSPQMLVRFRQDVISLHPKVVVIQAGGNDLAGYTGPATQETVAENFMSMVELAKVNGIRVVLAAVTPSKQTRLRSRSRVGELNEWIEGYAARSGSVYLDYYATLSDDGDFKKGLTADGLLPNDAGYNAMAPLAEKAIAEALAQKGAR